MTNHFTRVVDRKIATCLLVALVLPIAMQVSARAGETCPLEQKITPPDDDVSAYGKYIAIDGTVAIVGTPGGSYPAHTLRFDGVGWVEGESFPALSSPVSVAINGDIALVRRPDVHAYRFDGLTWVDEQTFSIPDSIYSAPVVLSAEWAAAGVFGVVGDESGHVYIYSYDGQSWVEDSILSGSDDFGAAVALENDIIAVGAPNIFFGAPAPGAVFVYRFNGDYWGLDVTLQASDGNDGDSFGNAVAVSNNTVVVGAVGDDDFGQNAGSVYVFEYDGIGWSECVKLNAPVEGGSGSFGSSVAIDGDLLIVGASGADIDDFAAAGAAFVYRREAGQWVYTQMLVASDAEASDGFGTSLALAGANVLIGAPNEDSAGNNAGALYAFVVDALDCNDNGFPDSCDITLGVSQDCNGNSLPDECEFIHFFSVESDQMAPIGDGFPQSLVVSAPPAAAGNVNLTIEAFGDFSSTSEWLDLDVNGTYVGTVVGGIFDDCATLPLVGNILVDADTFNALVGDGDAAVGITASSAVDPFLCETSYVTVSVAYQPIDGDCNANGVPDECDIESGSSADCNSDGLPDECEFVPRFIAASGPLVPIGAESPQSFIVESAPIATSDVTLSLEAVADLGASFEWIDVDVNGSFLGSVFIDTADDDCPGLPSVDGFIVEQDTFNDAVAGGDATINLVPTADVDGDLCLESFISVVLEYEIGPLSPDCNANGVLDECETDCNSNTIPDDCDVDGGTSPDCNENGIPDECDVESGTSDDCDSDGTPDECQLDCNENGVADPCDIAGGTSEDCAANGIPDECETDCNENGTPDECDITGGSSLDCNVNDIPDECEEDVCPGDVNADCEIDPLDSGFILARFGCSYPEDGENCLAADANGDGIVDPLDVGFVLARFGQCP